jgi:CPA1 family monovalent cation:H+ antiporter
MEQDARRAAANAALARIEQLAAAERLTDEAVRAVVEAYRERILYLTDELAEALGWSPHRQQAIEGRRLRREALAAEREQLIALHRKHRLSKELLHKLERELDLEEARLG